MNELRRTGERGIIVCRRERGFGPLSEDNSVSADGRREGERRKTRGRSEKTKRFGAGEVPRRASIEAWKSGGKTSRGVGDRLKRRRLGRNGLAYPQGGGANKKKKKIIEPKKDS